MSVKKSIGWTDTTRNPIKGRCLGGCWYCYYSGKRGFLERFKGDPEIKLDLSVFQKLPKKPKKIFLCSTHDLFGPWIHPYWRMLILSRLDRWRQHTFQILTKFPENITQKTPENAWLGITITGKEKDQWAKGLCLHLAEARLKFISFEPLLAPIEILDSLFTFDWVIVGRMTNQGKKYDPEPDWINAIAEKCRHQDIPIFMKDNLRDIWKRPLIQEFPE